MSVTTWALMHGLSYCHTHGKTQDAGEWVDESGDESCAPPDVDLAKKNLLKAAVTYGEWKRNTQS